VNVKITGIRKRPKILPDGRFVEVYQVSIVTGKGIEDTFDIEERELTPEKVRKMAEEKARILDAIVD